MHKHVLSRLTLAFVLCFCLSAVRAQEVRYTVIQVKIDSLIQKGLPKSALAEVDKLEQLARANKNPEKQIKVVLYRILLQGNTDQGGLAGVISRLKADILHSTYPAKPVLQSLLAEIYWRYYQQNRYKIAQRSTLKTPDEDFTMWDIKTLIKEVSNLYKQSLTDPATKNTSVSVFNDVLEGDTSTRYLRPTLYDLLAHRALSFFLDHEPDVIISRPVVESQNFSSPSNVSDDTTSFAYQGIKLIQGLTKFHSEKNEPAAVIDVALRRIKFLYQRSTSADKDSSYIASLLQITGDFPDNELSADALVSIGQFYRTKDSLVLAHKYLLQAFKAFPNSLGGENAKSLMEQIEKKEISVTVEDVNTPGKPILGLLTFRNITGFNYELYKLSAAQLNHIRNLQGTKNNLWQDPGNVIPSIALKSYLKKHRAIKSGEINIPDQLDFREHHTEFKIDGLAPGTYFLLANGSINNDELTHLVQLKVSALSSTTRVNPTGEIEIKVMHRETGVPLSDVKVIVKQLKSEGNIWKNVVIGEGLTKEGKFICPDTDGNNVAFSNTVVDLTIPGDTLFGNRKFIYGQTAANNQKDSSQRTVFFTDRQIYRPGQTIYFKGLEILQTNGKSQLVSDEDITVHLKDANNKTVSSLALKTNEFGTFNGTFIIPQNKLNGYFTISASYGSIRLRIEEYKRPTFSISFAPVKETYRFNDSVKVKGKALAFAGYGLSKIKVAYSITRTATPGDYRIYGRIQNGRLSSQLIAIKRDTVTADHNGNFEIDFKASLSDEYRKPGAVYTYAITATATEASGETRKAESFVTVGTDVLRVQALISPTTRVTDTLTIPVTLSNLNNQLQSGTVTARIYSLQKPPRIYKRRLWAIPDVYSMSKAEFELYFPDYAYMKEDDFSTWNKKDLVYEKAVTITENQPAYIPVNNLDNLPSDLYLVEISATDVHGDTTSSRTYTTLVTDRTAAAQVVSNWVITRKNILKSGEQAVFYVGLGKPSEVLMEVYDGDKMRSHQWIRLAEGQKKIAVPFAGEDNLRVQFLCILDNRMYAYSERIKGVKQDRELSMRFTTFRNKLEPGEKEQWKIEIKGTDEKNRNLAEMVATLYDASLNDITAQQNWTHSFYPQQSLKEYFKWNNYEFVKQATSRPFAFRSFYPPLSERNYEDFRIVEYYDYQNYLRRLNDKATRLERDNNLKKIYLKNAALIKTGFDISGRIIENNGVPLPEVKVRIKGTNITTLTNSMGEFKIKVPKGSVLVFSLVGYDAQELPVREGRFVIIKLKTDRLALNEVTVVGYAAQNRVFASSEVVGEGLAGKMSGIQIRGAASIVEDNSIRDFASINIPGRMPPFMPKQNNEISIRKNFNETAFFYPELRTNEKGEILIQFTIPETLTRWHFKGFAHTKDLKTGYIESEVVTQKQVMITANMPRFFREGDTLTVGARLANLTGKTVKGKAEITFFNAITMQPVGLLVNSRESSQAFKLEASSTGSVTYRMVIPPGLDAITYRLSADGGKFSDGEENTIPVLPNRILVVESVPMMVRAGQTKTYNLDKLINPHGATLQNKTLILEYTQNPLWYAVQALPYLMESRCESSEEIFSRYYANTISRAILNKLPAARAVFSQWKNLNSDALLSNLEKNQELKSVLIEETPWLAEAEDETEQKKRIALLFDLNKMENEKQTTIEKLSQMQMANGGFSWFAGARWEDRFITQHIIAGMGQLFRTGLSDKQVSPVTEKALKYLDEQLIEDYHEATRRDKLKSGYSLSALTIHGWYGRSYFAPPVSAELKKALNWYLRESVEEWNTRNVYEQALISLTLLRNKEVQAAKDIVRSLKETAQQSDELGMYWEENRYGYFWHQAPVETQSLLIELFNEIGNEDHSVTEMKIWLIRNKQVTNWKSTKATAAACYALLRDNGNLPAISRGTELVVGEKPLLTLKPNIKSETGTGYIKTSWVNEEIKSEMGKVTVKNSSGTLSWGALNWQYLEQTDKITSANTGLTIERKYYLEDASDKSNTFTIVNSENAPRPGDLLKVIIHLTADRDYEYVHLKDMRPSGTEPTSVLSGYKYQDGFFYYGVSRDANTNFFISRLPKGKYVFEYSLRVVQPGDFSTGISTIQSMYAPEFNAHSEGIRIRFNK